MVVASTKTTVPASFTYRTRPNPPGGMVVMVVKVLLMVVAVMVVAVVMCDL